MHSVNLDLLACKSSHYASGAAKDAHAEHRRDHLAALRATRKARRLLHLDRLRSILGWSASKTQGLADNATGAGMTGSYISPAE